MKIFISWSGSRSRAAAEVLGTYLPFILQDVKPFVSSHDLSSGGRWSTQLAKELDEASFGIICLTPDNLHSDWILFEAGALTKHIEGRACCLLLQHLGPADISGPLAQFQNRLFTRLEFAKLVADLNGCLAAPVAQGSLQLIFEKWWPDIDALIRDALGKEGPPPASSRREPINILEELLLRVRDIQKQVEDRGTSRSSDLLSGAASDRATRPEFIVSFKRIGSSIPDTAFSLDEFITFQMFLDDIYTDFLAELVPSSSYGSAWVLRDVETGGVVIHARMRSRGPVEPGIRDHRKLIEVGIRRGSTLEAIPLRKANGRPKAASVK